MAGALNATFGAPVVIYPGGGSAIDITGVIRDQDIEVADEEGQPVVATMTVLRAQKPDVVDLVVDDQVDGNGNSYRVKYRVPARSPASDRFEMLVLEII